MRQGTQEILGVISTIAVLGATPFVIVGYEGARRAAPTPGAEPGQRVVELTGVMRGGVWTDVPVRAAAYGFTEYPAAVIDLKAGETIKLRLKSADVLHGFYVPDLQLGPIEVAPGHVEEVALTAKAPGVYVYYCTAVCGRCHHFMRGFVRVAGADGKPPEITEAHRAQARVGCPGGAAREVVGAPPDGLVERGKWLFETKGCESCHGAAGAGGVRNPNYVSDTVPGLDELAERMMLFEKEDADWVIKALGEGRDPAAALPKGAKPPFPKYAVFQARYATVRGVVVNGNPAGKKDHAGPDPPLHMPAWGLQLSGGDIDSLLAWLISIGEFD